MADAVSAQAVKKYAIRIEPGERIVSFGPGGRYRTTAGKGIVEEVRHLVDLSYLTIDGIEMTFEPFEYLEVQR